MKPYPVEFRHRVIALTEQSMTATEIAEVLGVTPAWVRSIKQRHEAGESLDIKSSANKRRSLAQREGERIRARIAEKPGSTLEDLKRDLNLDTCIANLWKALQQLKISLKKKSLHAAERNRPDVVLQRAEWTVLATGIDPHRLIFLDETFGTTAMTRLYGWGPIGERLYYSVPHGHWKTTTFVSALRLDGLIAPMVVDGALNGAIFLKYVQQELAPRLRSGDILVLDNLQTHKVAGVEQALWSHGVRVVYLPPYSPDFNPIEQVYSKIKNELRRRELRTIPELEDAFGECLDWITQEEAAHYFENSGYATQGK
jgi:transposase